MEREPRVGLRLAQAELVRTTRHNTLASQKEQLNRLLGRDVRAQFAVESVSALSPLEIDLQAAQAQALARRPDVREAQLAVERAELDRRLASADRMPDVSLAAFMTAHFGREFVAYALDPFVSGVYAGDPARLSARHAFPRLWEFEQKHGSILRGQMAAAKARHSRGAAAGGIFSFREGLQMLTDALAGAPRQVAAEIGIQVPVGAVEPRQALGGRVLDADGAREVRAAELRPEVRVGRIHVLLLIDAHAETIPRCLLSIAFSICSERPAADAAYV